MPSIAWLPDSEYREQLRRFFEALNSRLRPDRMSTLPIASFHGAVFDRAQLPPAAPLSLRRSLEN